MTNCIQEKHLIHLRHCFACCITLFEFPNNVTLLDQQHINIMILVSTKIDFFKNRIIGFSSFSVKVVPLLLWLFCTLILSLLFTLDICSLLNSLLTYIHVLLFLYKRLPLKLSSWLFNIFCTLSVTFLKRNLWPYSHHVIYCIIQFKV